MISNLNSQTPGPKHHSYVALNTILQPTNIAKSLYKKFIYTTGGSFFTNDGMYILVESGEYQAVFSPIS